MRRVAMREARRPREGGVAGVVVERTSWGVVAETECQTRE
jgi:hypothetical protein